MLTTLRFLQPSLPADGSREKVMAPIAAAVRTRIQWSGNREGKTFTSAHYFWGKQVEAEIVGGLRVCDRGWYEKDT